jgi:hypothetical protein
MRGQIHHRAQHAQLDAANVVTLCERVNLVQFHFAATER